MRLRGIAVALVLAAIFWGVIVWFVSAWAYPTEADPQELHDKRLATIRYYRQEERLARAAAEKPDPPEDIGTAVTYSITPGSSAAILRAVGFPEEVIPTMLAIGERESGGDPSAVNGGGPAYAGGPACGWFQLFPCPGPEALNPWTNAAYAFQKYQAAGLAPWGG